MIRNIIIILIILAILFLSQQSYSGESGNNIYRKIEGWGKALWQTCKDFWDKNISDRITSEIGKRQRIAEEEIKKETNEIGQNVWEKTKDYFVGLFSGLFSRPSQ